MVIALLAALAAFSAGAGLVMWVGWQRSSGIVAQLRAEVSDARSLERLATERLIQARKDGFEVPVVPDSATPPVEESDELPPALAAIVNDWESPTARASQRKVIYQLMAEGLNEVQILQKLLPTPAAE